MTLYCVAIGDTVFRQLLQIGVRAVRVPAATPIVELLRQTQQYWRDSEPRVARRRRDPDRIRQLMAETEWREDDDRR